MMRLRHTLPAAALAALCCAAPGFATGSECGNYVTIERWEPLGAFKNKDIMVERKKKPVTFPSPLPGMKLCSGDRVKIEKKGVFLHLYLRGGRKETVSAENAAGKRGYPIKVKGRLTRWDNLLAEADKLLRLDEERRQLTAGTYTRGAEALVRIYPANPAMDFMLTAGERALHVRWSGGVAPFRVQLWQGGKEMGVAVDVPRECSAVCSNHHLCLAHQDAPRERSAVLPSALLVPGKYELRICDANPQQGWRREDVIVVAPDALPPMPKELAEAPLPDEARQLLYAHWLAQQGGGAWLLEAQQMAAALAASYVPAQEWLQLWSGE